MYLAVKSLQIYYDKGSLILFMSIIGNQKKIWTFFPESATLFPIIK